jgi:curved DNA-binding protein CbpA
MKNYYRILGVKKNASEEEIRARWIELMRKFHPDHVGKKGSNGQRIKEINEAYDTLKHSSTRVKYDLKRAYDRQGRRFHIQKMILPTSILIIFLVVGLFIFKKSQVAIKPKEVSKVVVQESAKIVPKEIEKVEETKPATIESPLAFPSVAEGELKSDEKPFKTLKSEIPVKVKKVVPKEISKVVVQESTRIVPKEVPKVEETKPTIQEPNVVPALTVVQSETPVNSSSYAAAGKQFAAKTDQIDPINEINKTNQINQRNEIKQTDQIKSKDSTMPKLDEPKGAVQVITPPPPIKVELQTAQFKPPLLIATEDEVRHFFANYTERYTQKDLDGFLSLFSPRAVQNRQDGLEGIRKIYGNFFKQSQEIEYHIDDIKIEVYQNAAEVKVRYELVQLLKKRGEKKIWRGDIRWSLIKEDGALKILSLDYQHQKSP